MDLERPFVAWDRREFLFTPYAFLATTLQALIRPWGLRLRPSPTGVLVAVQYWLWLIPLTLAMLAAVVGCLYLVGRFQAAPLLFSRITAGSWQGQLIKVLHALAFLATGLVIWLPALVALDLALWRRREAFAVASKAILYSSVWWAVCAALAAGAGNALMTLAMPEGLETFMRLGSLAWGWGPWPDYGFSPWPCWLAAALVVVQFVFVVPYTAHLDGRPRAVVRLTLSLNVFLAIYLLVLDRWVHLRFWLLFGGQEIDAWLQQQGLL